MSESIKGKPYIKEAKFWATIPGKPGYVQCNLCSRRCVIAPGKFGVCGVRRNIEGKLYTYVYGLLTAANLDPIEKKPLSHFNPGSAVFSISTPGCNFYCQFCQNWEIKQPVRDVVLAGNILEMLRYVDAVGKNVEISTSPFGGCGKWGQMVHVGDGGPTLRVSRLLVGGEK